MLSILQNLQYQNIEKVLKLTNITVSDMHFRVFFPANFNYVNVFSLLSST